MGLDSKLTTNSGLDIVGEQVKSRELVVSLGADSELVQSAKGRVQQMDYLYKFPEGQKIEKWLRDAFCDLDIRSDELEHWAGRDDNVTGYAPSASVGILLQNAIEHGSKFGELGPVELRGLFGRAVLLTIDDPGAGFDFSQFNKWFRWRRYRQIQSSQRERIAQGHKSGRRGGIGIEHVNEIANVDVWFEKLVDKFRTNLLFRRRCDFQLGHIVLSQGGVHSWGRYTGGPGV